MGGLGNQLFQIAQLNAYARRHNLEFKIPFKVEQPHEANQKRYIFHQLPYGNHLGELPEYKEPHFHYADIPKMDNTRFFGYFQSAKYFDDFRKEILEDFGFDWDLKKGWCSIHVRRGDYLRQPENHPVITEQYLGKAMKTVEEKNPGTKFLVFSDDQPWCLNFFTRGGLKKYDVSIAIPNSDIEDMQEASCCEFNIGSNSSYSWWIHYLNQNPDKQGVFPRTWFGPNLAHHDLKDLLPEKAIVL